MTFVRCDAASHSELSLKAVVAPKAKMIIDITRNIDFLENCYCNTKLGIEVTSRIMHDADPHLVSRWYKRHLRRLKTNMLARRSTASCG